VVGLDSRPRRWIRAPARTSSQVLQIDTSTWKKTKQWQIWNADHAFAPPSLALNSADEVGIALAWGGGGKFYASFAVGILGDFVVWFSEASNATDATNSGAGSNGRWGDHVTCRQAHLDSALFSGTGYAVLQKTPPAVGTQYNPATSCSVDGPTVASPVLSADPTLAGGGKPGAERQDRAQWVSPRHRAA